MPSIVNAVIGSTPEVCAEAENVVAAVVVVARRQCTEACGVVCAGHIAHSANGCITSPAGGVSQRLSNVDAA